MRREEEIVKPDIDLDQFILSLGKPGIRRDILVRSYLDSVPEADPYSKVMSIFATTLDWASEHVGGMGEAEEDILAKVKQAIRQGDSATFGPM